MADSRPSFSTQGTVRIPEATSFIRFKDAGIVRLAACTVLGGHAAARFSK
jgi:hypothetical protein